MSETILSSTTYGAGKSTRPKCFSDIIVFGNFQQTFLKKPRPTEAECLAFKLYKKLFCVKYPIGSPDVLALHISQLLNHYSSTRYSNDKSTSQDEKLNYYSAIFDYYNQELYKGEKTLTLKLILNDKEFDRKLSKYNVLKNPFDKQKSFLTPFD
ncbi:hypothetical protein [Alteromonas australica]|uniref:Uncharacterized protein n=1 Tax=Alteromonas australica TaxID=589873 RepID=A0A075P3N1_9ALTE|nr:hypothetical protein [Alteromonas australica]AIF97917.1 hypothetical protein EP13_03950 [Alteromonas australica]